MVDETTDISTTTQLIIYIKYLGKSDNNSKEDLTMEFPMIEYLDLVIPESASAIHIKLLYSSNLIIVLIQ